MSEFERRDSREAATFLKSAGEFASRSSRAETENVELQRVFANGNSR